MSDDPQVPPPPPSPALTKWWERRVYELAQAPVPTLGDEDKERHTLFSLLLMALVARYFNGNKLGATGEYPWRAAQRVDGGVYRGAPRTPGGLDFDFDYLGHNIAALAVDGHGDIIDFDFNHNEVLDSSVEHAEARLVRRVFGLTRIYDTWDAAGADTKAGLYGTVLKNVTVYTSLESCAQCSGIMTLGQVKQVVYLQTDPGQYRIGDIMYNLAGTAPEPVPADLFDFPLKRRLDEGYRAFQQQIADKPFYKAGTTVITSPSMTSFLCTDEALAIFTEGAEAFKAFTPAYEANVKILENARKFLAYAVKDGDRGTPHTL